MSTRGSIRVFGLSGSVTLLVLAASCAGEPTARSRTEKPEVVLPVERKSPAEANQLEIIASQGQVDFALVPAEAAGDSAVVEQLARRHCDEQRPRFCRVMMWKHQGSVPRSLPMSDTELMAQVAQYNRNRDTRYDCFYLMREGEMIDDSRLGNCG